MKILRRFFAAREGGLVVARRVNCAWIVLLSISCLGFQRTGHCQVAPAAYRRAASLTAGGTFSAYRINYDPQTLLGATAFVDANLNYHLGLEAEASWMTLRQRNDTHYETYMIGPRFTFNRVGRWQPYAKFMIGNGQFTFPFDYAHGGYLAIAPGGGVNYRLSRRLQVRVADVEYQYWPEFTFGSFSSVGVSSGIQYRFW